MREHRHQHRQVSGRARKNDMNEGSVMVDTGSMPVAPTTDTSTEATVEVREEGGEGQGQSQTDTTQQPQLTEKGTKVDPNPQSAVHQELANARRLVADYEKVLQSPELLAKYAKLSGMTLAEAKAEVKGEIKEAKQPYTAESFKTGEDVAKTLNELRTGFETELEALKRENQQLREGWSGFSEGQKVAKVASDMSQDVSSIFEKYPVLNPKSPEYNQELDNEIGSLFKKLDFDEKTGGFRGQNSLLDVTERFMRAVGIAQKMGSTKAQTEVVVKKQGQVVTSSGKQQQAGGNANVSAGTSIAQKVRAAMTRA